MTVILLMDLQQKSTQLDKNHASIFWSDISVLNSSMVLYHKVKCILLLYHVSMHCKDVIL